MQFSAVGGIGFGHVEFNRAFAVDGQKQFALRFQDGRSLAPLIAIVGGVDFFLRQEAHLAGRLVSKAVDRQVHIDHGLRQRRRSSPSFRKITYFADQDAPIEIKVYNLMGERVVTLLESSSVTPGRAYVDWFGTNTLGQYVASGVYFVKLKVGSRVSVSKVVVTK